jgi:glycosyltransferase involved in cell wall biosynthesis
MSSTANAALRTVLVCKCELLHPSETFVREQVLSYRRWKPVLIGFREVTPGLALDALDVRLLDVRAADGAARVHRKLLAALGLPPRRAVARLRREAASLVHVHFATDAVKFWPIIRGLNLPVLVTLHGYDINIHRECWEQPDRSLGERRYPKRLLALARQPRVHFVAVSQAIRRRAIEFGIPTDRIHVRYLGVDLARFHASGTPISSRPPRILYVGRLVEKKGAEFLIQAFAKVRDRIPQAELALIGDGPERRRLTELASRLQLPVAFLGVADSAEVKRQIDLARVFCLPSITARDGDAEGLGLSILEAQACGVPAVTSARGGAEEGIIDGSTGFAFPERDVEALTARLLSVLSDDALALRMSCAAPQFVAARFDIRNCTRALESLYDSVAGVA